MLGDFFDCMRGLTWHPCPNHILPLGGDSGTLQSGPICHVANKVALGPCVRLRLLQGVYPTKWVPNACWAIVMKQLTLLKGSGTRCLRLMEHPSSTVNFYLDLAREL